MAGALFGVPNGLRAYQDDQMKLSELASQNKARDAQIALSQAQVANMAADNARADNEAKRKQDEAADAQALQAKLAELAQGGGADAVPGAPALAGGSRFDSLLQAGERQVRFLINTGRVGEAMKLMPALTGGVKDLDQARQAASAAKENKIDAEIKKHDFSSRALSGVRDQATYDMARMQLASSGLFGEEDFKEMPARYDPRFIAQAIAGSAAAKQKADLARKASRTAALNASTRDEIGNRKLVRDLDNKRLKLAEDREARLEKQGEARMAALGGKKPPGAPMPREIAAVTAELKRLGVKVETDMTPALRNDLVEEVRARISTGASSWGEATAAVVAEMKADGRLEESMIGRDEYKPDGKTAKRGLPMPATPAELKPNTYYTIGGETRLFDGTKFVAKGAGK